MKKLSFLLFALLCCFTANADLYVTGNLTGWNWQANEGHMTESTGAIFTYKYVGTVEKNKEFLITNGSWDYKIGAKSSTQVNNGVAVQAVSGGGSNFVFAETMVNPTFVCDAVNYTVTVTTESTEPSKPDVITYDIWGTIGGTTEWAKTELTEADGKWSVTGDFKAGSFGIRHLVNGEQGGNPDWYNHDNMTVTADAGVISSTSGNLTLAADGNYTITFDPEVPSITIKANGVVTPPEPVKDSFSIYGTIFDGAEWTATPMEGEADVYTLKATVKAGQFIIKGTKNNAEVYYGPQNGMLDVALNVAMTAGTSVMDQNWKLTEAQAGELTFVFDATAMTLTVKGEEVVTPEPEPEVAGYAIKGGYADAEWGTTVLELKDGAYTFAGYEVKGEGYTFGVMSIDKEEKQVEWFGYDDLTINAPEGTVSKKESDGNINIVAGTYDFAFAADTKTLTITAKTVTPEVVTYKLNYGKTNEEWKSVDMTGEEVVSAEITIAEGLNFNIVASDGKIYMAAKDSDSTVENGVAKAAIVQDLTTDNAQNFWIAAAGTYTVAFDAKASTVKVTWEQTVTPEPEPEIVAYYLEAGYPNNTWGKTELTLKDGAYVFDDEYKVEGEGYAFCIKGKYNDETKEDKWFGYEALTINAPEGVASKSGDNVGLAQGSYTFSLDAKTMTLTIAKYEAPVEKVVYNLNFGNNDQNNWYTVALTEGEAGKWVLKGYKLTADKNMYISSSDSKEFYVSNAQKNSEENSTVVAGENACQLNAGETYQNFWMTAGVYDLTFDPTAKTLTAVLEADEATITVYYDNTKSGWDVVYVHYFGQGTDSEWPGVECVFKAASESAMMRVASGVHEAEIPAHATGIIFNNGKNSTEEGAAQTETLVPMHGYSYDQDGVITTGVEDIVVEGAEEVVYYNLQGVRIANPERGLYIRVANGKTSKVIL